MTNEQQDKTCHDWSNWPYTVMADPDIPWHDLEVGDIAVTNNGEISNLVTGKCHNQLRVIRDFIRGNTGKSYVVRGKL